MNNNWLIILLIAAGVIVYMSKRQNAVNNISNAETWKWVDYRGKEREITITRDVHVC
jgi:hypothetical protein